jgi:hypothetical protein
MALPLTLFVPLALCCVEECATAATCVFFWWDALPAWGFAAVDSDTVLPCVLAASLSSKLIVPSVSCPYASPQIAKAIGMHNSDDLFMDFTFREIRDESSSRFQRALAVEVRQREYSRALAKIRVCGRSEPVFRLLGNGRQDDIRSPNFRCNSR